MPERNKFLKTLVLLLLIAGLIIFIYHDLPKTFFQQDEWSAFGHIIYRQSLGGGWLSDYFFSSAGLAHFTPLNTLFYQTQFKLFGLNFSPYAWVSIFLHLINTFLVFYLALLLFSSENLAFVSGLIFATYSFSHQAVSWVATSGGTLNSALFLLLSLILFFKNKPALSVLSFAISLGFKENSIFLFIFFPFLGLIFSRETKIFKYLFTLAAFYLALRFFLKINAPSLSGQATLASFAVYLYRILSLPFKIIPQGFVSARQLISLAKYWLTNFHPQTSEDLIIETVGVDLICFLLTVAFCFFFWFFYQKLKQKKQIKEIKILFFSLGLIILSGLPFIFIPGKAGYFSLYEPRNLYITSIGAALFLSLIGRFFLKQKPILFWLFILMILGLHIKNIHRDLDNLLEVSQTRKIILEQIKASYPDLPQKVIFYTESDTSYYGLPAEEKILPFQSGFGQTLVVWYNSQENFPPCFHKDVFLYELTAQGYRECQGRGFGYFRDFNKLKQALKESNLTTDSVFAFEWQKNKNKIFDVTEGVRRKLKKETF